jgi:hypothetical protein
VAYEAELIRVLPSTNEVVAHIALELAEA